MHLYKSDGISIHLLQGAERVKKEPFSIGRHISIEMCETQKERNRTFMG